MQIKALLGWPARVFGPLSEALAKAFSPLVARINAAAANRNETKPWLHVLDAILRVAPFLAVGVGLWLLWRVAAPLSPLLLGKTTGAPGVLLVVFLLLGLLAIAAATIKGTPAWASRAVRLAPVVVMGALMVFGAGRAFFNVTSWITGPSAREVRAEAHAQTAEAQADTHAAETHQAEQATRRVEQLHAGNARIDREAHDAQVQIAAAPDAGARLAAARAFSERMRAQSRDATAAALQDYNSGEPPGDP